MPGNEARQIQERYMKTETERLSLPDIGAKIVWASQPQLIWVVDAHLPELNQFEAYIEGKPLEAARFDVAQLKGASIEAK